MQLLATYRIRVVPRFGAEEMQVRIYDSLLGQRGFWNYLISRIVQDHGATVELRLVSRGLNTELVPAVRVHGESSEALYAALWQLQHMLPEDYVWDQAPGGLDGLPSRLRMARIVRRLHFVDLPSLLPGMQAEGTDRTGKAEAGSNLSRQREFAPGELRTLPTLRSLPREVHTTQFCVALPAPLDAYTPRQRVLFEGMQRAGNSIVSICIHPVRERLLGNVRAIAQHWHRFLEPFVAHLSDSGLGEETMLHEAYAKFNLPERHLLHVTLRVATSSDTATVRLANLLAASIGGARAFNIYPPSIDSDPENLTRSDLDIPSANWSPNRLRAVQAELLTSLREHRIRELGDDEDDNSARDLLLQLPHVYNVEMAERMLSLPIADEEGLPGVSSKLQPPFTTPSISFTPVCSDTGVIYTGSNDVVRLGMVRHGGAPSAGGAHKTHFTDAVWHGMHPRDLTKHALIVGSTGSGKTMTTLFLTREIARLNVPFMVIEPVKTEYYDRLKHRVPKLFRFRLERLDWPDFLAFDPFRLPPEITVVKHASYLKSCFEAAFPLEPVSSLVLATGILKYYISAVDKGGCGLKKFEKNVRPTVRGRKVFPSFATFRDFFLTHHLTEEFPASTNFSSQLAQDMANLFRRRLDNLDIGPVGDCFRIADERTINTKGKVPLSSGTLYSAFHANSVVELDAVPDAEHKALLMAFLLTFVFELRQGEDLRVRDAAGVQSQALKHMLFVEEAHRVLSTGAQQSHRGGEMAGVDSQAKAVSLFVDMLAEIRAFGQGIAIVEQIPTKIVSEAIKNTNLKIMLRLTSREDREYLGEAMNFTEAQKRFVTNLKTTEEGINFVVFEEGVDQPLMLTLPFERLEPQQTAPTKNWLYDPFFPLQEEGHA